MATMAGKIRLPSREKMHARKRRASSWTGMEHVGWRRSSQNLALHRGEASSASLDGRPSWHREIKPRKSGTRVAWTHRPHSFPCSTSYRWSGRTARVLAARAARTWSVGFGRPWRSFSGRISRMAKAGPGIVKAHHGHRNASPFSCGGVIQLELQCLDSSSPESVSLRST